MPKIESVLRSEIIRMAKREVRSMFLPLKRNAWQMKTKLSGLTKMLAPIDRVVKEKMHREETRPKLEASLEEVKASRLTPDRIRGLRRKLGISQRELAILTGASLGAILSWEKGKFKPKPEKKTTLVALRKLGKREVRKILEQKPQMENPLRKKRNLRPIRKKESRPGSSARKKLVSRKARGEA